MGKKNVKPRVIPEQDGRIIGVICMCQLTMILSGVALVYLSVAVYAPSHRAFNSGFETTPVMCETINMTLVNNCPWTSCGEWCLSRPSGYCEQILVTVRRHGSDLSLSGCTGIQSVSCPKANVEDLSKANCNKPTECNHMKGLFSCNKGHCANISEMMQCLNRGEGPSIDVDKDSGKLTGNYECLGARCSKIKRQLECENICPPIRTGSNNVFISLRDDILSARCSKAEASDPSAPGPKPAPLWLPSDGTLLVSCYTTNRTLDSITASDCINGTVIQPALLPQNTMNYTQLRFIWSGAMDSKDYERPRSNKTPRGGALLPPADLLSVHEGTSRLYINLKSCVNTLRGECKKFIERYGSDGRNHSARSRFPCYHNTNDTFLVLARFDLDETWRELIIAVLVPVILFIISLTTLCIITRSVKVGDDAKLRCLSCCCSSTSSSSRNTLETQSTT